MRFKQRYDQSEVTIEKDRAFFGALLVSISRVHLFEILVEPLRRPLYHITLIRGFGNAMPFVRVIKQFSFGAVMFERTPELESLWGGTY